MNASPRRRETLQRSLTRQFVLLACVPLAVVVLTWIAVAIPKTLADIESQNQRVVGLVRSQVDLLLATPRQAVLQAARHLGAGGTDPLSTQAAHAALREALDVAPALESAVLLDERGIVAAAEVRPGAGMPARDWEGLDFSTRPFYAAARAHGGPSWSDTFLSPLSGRISAVIAVPVGARLLVADLSLASLAEEMRAANDAGRLAVILFDGGGRVIVHPQQELADWQENLRRVPLVAAALEGRPGSGGIDIGGQPWFASISPAGSTSWFVMVAQPRRVLFDPLRQLLVVALVGLLVAAATVALVATRLARHQAARYRHLFDAAARLAAQRNPGEAGVDPATAAASVEPAEEVDLGIEEINALWTQLRRLLDDMRVQERTAEQARGELQAVLDAATEAAIVAMDLTGTIRLVNRGFEKMLGWSAAESVGQLTPERLYLPEELAVRAADLSRQLGRPVQGLEATVALPTRLGHEVRDWTLVRKDGTRLPATVAVTAVRDAQGRLTGFLGVATDQSERQRSARLELERSRAEAASQAKSEFLSRVSHELRTPLNAMLGYAQLLSMDGQHPLDAQQAERVARIETAGWHLVRLIDDVLDLSSIETGQVRMDLAPVDLAPVIAKALELVAPQAERAGIDLRLAPWPAEMPRARVRADATRLRQVVTNLISNGVKYNRPGGHVTVRLRRALDDDGTPRVALDVEDSGLGLNAAQRQRLFMPFDRLGREASAVQGVGIGLVISKRLVERMGGRLDVASEPGVGSTFTVSLLPGDGTIDGDASAPDEAIPDQAEAARQGEAAFTGSGQSGVRDIVAVEDQPANAQLLRELIAGRPDWRLHVAPTVADALALLARQRPSLVLVDWHLPDGSGADVVAAVRALPGGIDVPVIVVSADVSVASLRIPDGLEVQGVLTKPLEVGRLVSLMEECLEAGAAAPAHPGGIGR